METKTFYLDGLWEQIVNHPDFDIGRRELEALIRFLSTVAVHTPRGIHVLHLGIGDGREIPRIVSSLSVGEYVLNDICAPVLERATSRARSACPSVRFRGEEADIELEGNLSSMRSELHGPTIFVLAGNAVIFSDRRLDGYIRRAMRKGDLLLVTAEVPHESMDRSYAIDPVYDLLAHSGIDVHADSVTVAYDASDQCLKMTCGGHVLLASYKPTPDQLRSRLRQAGMVEVALQTYEDIHMVAGLFTSC